MRSRTNSFRPRRWLSRFRPRHWVGAIIGVAAILGVAVLVATPGLFAGGATAAAEGTEEPPPRYLTTPVRSGALSSSLRVTATLRSDETTIPLELSPSAEGRAVLSKAEKTAGDAAESGDLVAEVSGEPRIVLSGSVPLWRDIAIGDSGADVDALQAALVSLGHLSDAGESWDLAAVDAVRQLLTETGYSLEQLSAPPPTDELEQRVEAARSQVEQLSSPPATSSVLAAQMGLAEAERQREAMNNEAAAAVAAARALVEDLEDRRDSAEPGEQRALERELEAARRDLRAAEERGAHSSAAGAEQVALAQAMLDEVWAPQVGLEEARKELASAEQELAELERTSTTTIPGRIFLMAPALPADVVSAPQVGFIEDGAALVLATGEVLGVADLPSDTSDVSPGAPVAGTIAGQTMTGSVRGISETDEGRQVVLVFENVDRQSIVAAEEDVRVDVDVTLDTIEDAIIVPTVAITGSGVSTEVRTVEGSLLRTHEVVVRLSTGGETAVVSETLRPGDEVLVGVE